MNKIPKEDLKLNLHGNTYTLAEMENEGDDRWNMGELAQVLVRKEGGLPKGEHTIFFLVNMRISYLPFPAIRKSERTLAVA